MDQQALDAFQQRLTKMERRLKQVLVLMLVGLFVMTTAVAVNFVAKKASAQGSFDFRPWTGPIYFAHDPTSGATCFTVQVNYGLSCVK